MTSGLRVVVIGATGNVGSALLRRLVHEPGVREIHGVARRLPHAQEMMALPMVRWHAADITTGSLDVIAGADVVVHLAWRIQTRPMSLMLRTNLGGTQRVLDAVVEHRVPVLVYASSVGTYAPGPKEPVDEQHPATGVTSSAYSCQKAEAERMLEDVQRRHRSLRIVRMRTSLVLQRRAASEVHRLFLGPLLPWHLPHVLRLVPRSDRVVVQVTHADDVAAAYVAAITRSVSGPFNVAADPPLTADAIAAVVGGRSVAVPMPAVRAAMDVGYRTRLLPTEPGWLDVLLETPLMDTTRARTELGWEPVRGATETLLELLDGIGDGDGGPSEPLRPRRVRPLPS